MPAGDAHNRADELPEETCRLIDTAFPQDTRDYARRLLREYAASDTIGGAGPRVYAALVKLSRGRIDLLKHHIANALKDWRDPLYWTEYNNDGGAQ